LKSNRMTDIQTYTIEEAIKKVKETSKVKFDPTVELHINLDLDKKGDQNVRFILNLPHGTGKTPKVAVLASKKIAGADLELNEDDIEKIEKGTLKPKTDFDVLVAEPRFMPKIAKAAKILGPAGAMPNPKTGTVTEDVEKAVEQIKKGKVEIRTEPNAPVIHTILGKLSFENKALEENYQEVINAVKSNKPQKAKPEWIRSVYVTSTMGPAFMVEV
jgi:large subunit ribosomal protein L1